MLRDLSTVSFPDLIEKNAGDGVRSFYNHLGEAVCQLSSQPRVLWEIFMKNAWVVI